MHSNAIFKPGTIKKFHDSFSYYARRNKAFEDAQIELVKAGVRDGRLHDNCIILLDGMKKYPW